MMGYWKSRIIELEYGVLAGDERARASLLELDAPQALWGINDKFDLIANYVESGWSIVPQLAGEKKPCVKWKPHQTVAPTVSEILNWFRRWPTAGPAVVLGPVSNLFAVDVDGEDAHRELLRRLKRIPRAPKVRSGSGQKYRYHLYFRCPMFLTKAKATPWHEKLEFRGQGGIIVLPPSLHKSGRRYQWPRARALHELPLLNLPEAILGALQERKSPKHAKLATQNNAVQQVVIVPGVCRSTREFLGGKYAHADGWNSRLFHAACDLAGNGVPVAKALPLLLAGARPWNASEEARARATVESAYSQPRVPARLLGTT